MKITLLTATGTIDGPPLHEIERQLGAAGVRNDTAEVTLRKDERLGRIPWLLVIDGEARASA